MAADFKDIFASIGVGRLEVYVYGVVDECTGPVAIIAVACEAGQGRFVENGRPKLNDSRSTRTHDRKGRGANWRGQRGNGVSGVRHTATQTRLLLKAKRKRSRFRERLR